MSRTTVPRPCFAILSSELHSFACVSRYAFGSESAETVSRSRSSSRSLFSASSKYGAVRVSVPSGGVTTARPSTSTALAPAAERSNGG